MDAAIRLEWLVIGLMGLVTFVTRVAGVGLARWIPQTPFWQSFVQHLPTTLLVAIAAPAFASGDPILTIAAVVTLLAATRGWNLIICMSLGVGVVALMRALSG
jgi:uncharacterized membrane protein